MAQHRSCPAGPQAGFLGRGARAHLIFLYPSPSLTYDKGTRRCSAAGRLLISQTRKLKWQRVGICPKGSPSRPRSPLHLQQRMAKKLWPESWPCPLPGVWLGLSLRPRHLHSLELPQPGLGSVPSTMKGQMQGAAGFSWGLFPGLLPKPSQISLPHAVLQGQTFQALQAGSLPFAPETGC